MSFAAVEIKSTSSGILRLRERVLEEEGRMKFHIVLYLDLRPAAFCFFAASFLMTCRLRSRLASSSALALFEYSIFSSNFLRRGESKSNVRTQNKRDLWRARTSACCSS